MVKCFRSKINLIFYGVAEKVEKVKGLAARICGIHWLLAAQAVSG